MKLRNRYKCRKCKYIYWCEALPLYPCEFIFDEGICKGQIEPMMSQDQKAFLFIKVFAKGHIK